MGKYTELVKNRLLQESSLSRIWKHMSEHDCGTITGWRFAENCGEGRIYTRKEKDQRNISVKYKLLTKRYGIINIQGSYVENYENSEKSIEVKENAFFVVDINDKTTLKEDLIDIGKQFEQDSIMFIPKNGDKAILIGTNNCPLNDLKGGKEFVFNKRELGKEGQFMSKINGRPFKFIEIIETSNPPMDVTGLWGFHEAAKKHWSTFN